MSNNTSPVVYDEVMPDVSPEAASEKTLPEMPPKKNIAARVFAAILAVFSIGFFFAPTISFDGGQFSFGAFENNWFNVILALFKEGQFGVIESSNPISMISLLLLYILWALLIVSAVLGIITIFCSKKAPAMLRVTAWIFTSALALYSLWFLGLSFASSDAFSIPDLAALALTVVGMIICLVLAVKKVGKTAWINALQYILSLAAVAATLLVSVEEAFTDGLEAFGIPSDFIGMIWLAIAELLFADLVIAGIRVATKKGLVLDLIRYIVQILVAGLSLYFVITKGNGFDLTMILAIVAAGVSLIQIVLCIIQMCVRKKAKKAAKAANETNEIAEEAPAAVEEEYVREEYAEAIPYDGGPVEGVELAEEVVPTPPAPQPEVQTAGYDYYNSRSFDPFIASLADKERNEFTELFILKYKGPMPEIPDYQVGGDNKEFFRKIFIYLGQYRDRIPDGLLAKIYQFAVRM